MKLWVDDMREPPDTSWIVARSAAAAIDVLRTGWVTELSLDHDLGDGRDGYEVAAWLEMHPALLPWRMDCHSANPVGRERIMAAFEGAQRLRGSLTLSSISQSATPETGEGSK